MIRTTRKRLTLVVLGLTLAVVPFAGEASAQATGDRTGANTTTTRTDRDDDGFNPGWLGLIGLAGLAGLMPKKSHTVTTHRSGDTSGR